MWLILTLASLSTTIGIIRTIWDKFQTEPTLTELDMVTNHIEFDFPQILLCFDWPRLNHSHLVKACIHFSILIYLCTFKSILILTYF